VHNSGRIYIFNFGISAGISDFGISDLAGITDYGFGISANLKYFGFGTILSFSIFFHLLCKKVPKWQFSILLYEKMLFWHICFVLLSEKVPKQ
jgi:hypothetical protein